MGTSVTVGCDTEVVEEGERMLIPCDGGPCISRLVHFPPPFEFQERGGTYVLVDDGPPNQWRYEFIPEDR